MSCFWAALRRRAIRPFLRPKMNQNLIRSNLVLIRAVSTRSFRHALFALEPIWNLFLIWRFKPWAKISSFYKNFKFWPHFWVFIKNSSFYQNFEFWPKFRVLTKISSFDQNFEFWPKFRILVKISILSKLRILKYLSDYITYIVRRTRQLKARNLLKTFRIEWSTYWNLIERPKRCK